MNVQSTLNSAKDKKVENKKYLKWLKAKHPPKLDVTVQNFHEEVFESMDCLQCANCCKTTSPIFYKKDIERAAKALRMKAVEFEHQYLYVDGDGDYVLHSAPCPFLMDDNACNIYEDRPTACREYPHTNRKNFIQLIDLTYNNTLVCPAVVNIVEKLKLVFNVANNKPG
jgi:uncharacterized protein